MKETKELVCIIPQLTEVSPQKKLKEKEANLWGGGLILCIDKVTCASAPMVPIPRIIPLVVWYRSIMRVSHLK